MPRTQSHLPTSTLPPPTPQPALPRPIQGFWKGWHSSYNRWLVRYAYVPLGGTPYRLLNIWPIFLFVAVWHDLEWRLLGWALLTCTAFFPELAAKRLANTFLKSPSGGWRAPGWRHIAALAATLNILALMGANLAGFVLGVEGVAGFARSLLRDGRLLGCVLGVLFSAAQLMFALREGEAQCTAGARP